MTTAEGEGGFCPAYPPQVICNGTDLAVRNTVLAAGSGACPQGGVLVESGIDQNNDGMLSDPEVQSSSVLCGAPSVLLESIPLTAEDGCENGGIRVLAGRDDGLPRGAAADGVLQPEEVESTQDLCQDDVLVSGGSGSCSFAPNSGKGAGSNLAWTALGLALVIIRRRRRG